ncbi:hypothetical protein [Oceanirhabdus seepicola]|uniref:Uncharacterized protein n=1 Tax=Oceanirhabdus seepicola TaxID=2828781 RepID=A0A9J6NYZ2_9CLOT|nr:hypothetical protein [Oceanirhabdus seepicola]MCM1989129.1 hypothetical protein [Oceanirhabdus seepicola]
MEFEYKDQKNGVYWIVFIVCAVMGLIIFNDKSTNNSSIFVIVMIVNMFMQFMRYKNIKNKGMGIVDYLDYGRVTKWLIIMFGIIAFCVAISGKYANYIMGILLIILAIILIFVGDLFKKSNEIEEGYPSDKIILNEEGIKIPAYKFIKWDDISNVLEYETREGSIIGVLVSSERAYKIKKIKLEDRLFGKNVRLITIFKNKVICKGGLNTSQLVDEIKEKMKG